MTIRSSNLSSISHLKALLSAHGLSPRRSLGQNFLVDRSALHKIAQAADLDASDTVIEVGPGPGVLTRELLPAVARVIAVEKDERMAELLRAELGGDPRLRVVAADMMQTTPEELLASSPLLPSSQPPPSRFGKGAGGLGPYKVVANLPYYVAAPIVRRFLEAQPQPELLVVLLQKEVAQQAVAQPGEMSMFSLAIQYYAAPSLRGTIRAGSFYPEPKVDSAILRLDVRKKPAVDVPPDLFFRVARAGFTAPRKQIANSLTQGLKRASLPAPSRHKTSGPPDALCPKREEGIVREAIHSNSSPPFPLREGGQGVRSALESAGIDPRRRAETLTLAEWAALCHTLNLDPSG